MRVCAVASGTSADGLDVAVVDLGLEAGDHLHGHPADRDAARGPTGCARRCSRVLPPAATTVGAICQLDQLVGLAVADAVQGAVEQLDRPPHLVVSPGHTVYHDVRDGTATAASSSGSRPGSPSAPGSRSSPTCGRATSPRAARAPRSPAPSTPCGCPRRGDRAPPSTSGGSPRHHRRRRGRAGRRLGHRPGHLPARPRGRPRERRSSDRDDDGLLAAAGNVRLDLLEALLEHPHFSRAAARLDRPGGVLGGVPRRRPRPRRRGGRCRPARDAHRADCGHGGARPRAVRRHRRGGVRRRRAQPDPDGRDPAPPRRRADDAQRRARDPGRRQGGRAVGAARLPDLARRPRDDPSPPAPLEPRVLGRITPGAGPLRLPPPANAFHKRPRRLRVLTTAGGT